MSDIVERLGDIYATDDHVRGCSGREYDCSCGYDERSAETARAAAAEITRLRGLVEVEEAGKVVGDMPERFDLIGKAVVDRDHLRAVNLAVIGEDVARAFLDKLADPDPTRGKP